jgi:hypothetical protein
MDFRTVGFRPFRAGLCCDVRTQGKQPRRLRAEAFLTGLTVLTALTVLRADRMDTVNEVNNVRRQSSQHGQSSQPCPKPNAPAAGGWKKPGTVPEFFLDGYCGLGPCAEKKPIRLRTLTFQAITGPRD